MKNSINTKGLFHQLTKQQKLQRLLHRFGQQSYTEKNLFWKNTALIWSYLVNIASIATAFYGLLWFLQQVISNYYFAAAVTALALIMITLAQRKSSDNFWDAYWMTDKPQYTWLAVSFGLMALSMLSSGWGTYQGNKDTNDGPVLITTDSTLNDLQLQLADVNGVIEANKNTTWKGKIVEQARINIAINSDIKKSILQEISERRAKLESENETIIETYQEEEHFVGTTLLLLYILLEITFEGCMCFCSFYDYRKFLEEISELPYPEQKKLLEGKINGSEINLLQQPVIVSNRQIGFKTPNSNNSNKPVSEVKKQTVTARTEQPEQLVPQASQPEQLISNRTVIKEPNKDISGWKQYASVYYKRSVKASSKQSTRDDNREKYEEYRDLILATNNYDIIEHPNRLEFVEK